MNPKHLAALSILLASISPTLPDGDPGSVRSITQAVALGLMGAALYLGAPKPEPIA